MRKNKTPETVGARSTGKIPSGIALFLLMLLLWLLYHLSLTENATDSHFTVDLPDDGGFVEIVFM